jgi:betaine-aldehyde dehydrogenase
MVLTQSIGVAGIIAPWNSPYPDDPSLAPALAAGCTAVIKCRTNGTDQLRMAEVMASVKSLPKGSSINLRRRKCGAALMIESPDVPIDFLYGQYTNSACLMRMCCELKRFGSSWVKDTDAVFDDADLDAALPTLEKAVTVFAGQFCMTGSRILVQRGIADSLSANSAND